MGQDSPFPTAPPNVRLSQNLPFPGLKSDIASRTADLRPIAAVGSGPPVRQGFATFGRSRFRWCSPHHRSLGAAV